MPYGAGMATELDADDVITQVTKSLSDKFPQRDPEDVETRVRHAVDDLKDRPVTDYVGVLAERAVKDELKRE